MSTFLQIMEHLAPRLRMDETKTAQKTLLTGFVRRAQNRLEQEEEWPFNEQRDVTESITSSTGILTLTNTDVSEITEITIEDASVTPSESRKLTQLFRPLPELTWNTLFGTDPTATAERNQPTHYLVEYASGAIRVRLSPLPDAAYTLHIYYIRRLAELSADGDTNYFTDNMPHVLIDGATIEGYMYLNESDKLSSAESLYQRGLGNARKKILQPSSRSLDMARNPNVFKKSRYTQ